MAFEAVQTEAVDFKAEERGEYRELVLEAGESAGGGEVQAGAATSPQGSPQSPHGPLRPWMPRLKVRILVTKWG